MIRKPETPRSASVNRLEWSDRCVLDRPTLFHYVLRYDDGAAPNPFWGTCTLVICKPGIRLAAKEGDWIVGLGSKSNPVHRDYRGKIVFAMQVDRKMTMEAYDEYTKKHLPQKIPAVEHPIGTLRPGSRAWKLRLGDSIYDFSKKGIPQRDGVHRRENRGTDRKGMNALLSWQFVYYGREPINLPTELEGILHKGRGFRSKKNGRFIDAFRTWWDQNAPGSDENRVRGLPQWDVFSEPRFLGQCSAGRRREGEKDTES